MELCATVVNDALTPIQFNYKIQFFMQSPTKKPMTKHYYVLLYYNCVAIPQLSTYTIDYWQCIFFRNKVYILGHF